jgi:hypothetical protein
VAAAAAAIHVVQSRYIPEQQLLLPSSSYITDAGRTNIESPGGGMMSNCVPKRCRVLSTVVSAFSTMSHSRVFNNHVHC